MLRVNVVQTMGHDSFCQWAVSLKRMETYELFLLVSSLCNLNYSIIRDVVLAEIRHRREVCK